MEKCLSRRITESSPAPQPLPTHSPLVFYSLNSRHETAVSSPSKTQEDKRINSLCCSTRRCINRPDSFLSFHLNGYNQSTKSCPFYSLYVSEVILLLPYSALGKVFTTSCPDYCNCILNDHTDQARTKKCLESKYLRLMVSKSNSLWVNSLSFCAHRIKSIF